MECCVVVEFRNRRYFSVFNSEFSEDAFSQWLNSCWWKKIPGIGIKARDFLCSKAKNGELNSETLPEYPSVLRSWSLVPKVGFIWIDFVSIGYPGEVSNGVLVYFCHNQGTSLRLLPSPKNTPSDLIRIWVDNLAPIVDKFEDNSYTIASLDDIKSIKIQLKTIVRNGVSLSENVWLSRFSVNNSEAEIGLICIKERLSESLV